MFGFPLRKAIPTSLLCSGRWQELRPGKSKRNVARLPPDRPRLRMVHGGSLESGYRALCGQCFNSEMAKLEGLERFEHFKLEPIHLADCAGKKHEFHFRTRLFGTGLALELTSFEMVPGRLSIPDHRRARGRSSGTARAIDREDTATPISQGCHPGRVWAEDRGSPTGAWHYRVGRISGGLCPAARRRWL